MQLDHCLTVFSGKGRNSEMLVLVAKSPELYRQSLKLLQDMTGTVVNDSGKEYAAFDYLLHVIH